MFGLHAGTQVIYHTVLGIDLFFKLFQVLSTADLFAFDQSHAATREGVATSHIFTRLLNNYRCSSLLECGLRFGDVYLAQQVLGQVTVFRIDLHHVEGGDQSGYGIRGSLAGCLLGKLIQQEEIGFPFSVGVEQLYGSESGCQIVHHVVAQERLQYVFQSGTEFFPYIEHVGQDRCSRVPGGVIVQEFYRFRVTFHRIDHALEQVVFVSLGVQFAGFFGQLISQSLQHGLRLEDLLLGVVLMFLELLQVNFLYRQFLFGLLILLGELLFVLLTLRPFRFDLLDGPLQVLNGSIGYGHLFLRFKLLTLHILVCRAGLLPSRSFGCERLTKIFDRLAASAQLLLQLAERCFLFFYLLLGEGDAFLKTGHLPRSFLQEIAETTLLFFEVLQSLLSQAFFRLQRAKLLDAFVESPLTLL